jgi:hypothetical protein
LVIKHIGYEGKSGGWAIPHWGGSRKVSINCMDINIMMCEKLYIYRKYNLQDAITCYLENRSDELYEAIKNTINSYVDAPYHYVGHTNLVRKIRPMVKKLHYIFDDSMKIIAVNDILLKILDADVNFHKPINNN